MARKNVGKSENNPYRMASACQDNVKEKVLSVREVVGLSKSTNEIILVLQYFDYNVESTIQAYLEDHAQAALTEWHCPNNKVVSKKKKKNKPKTTANHQSEPGSSDQSGSSTPVIPAQAEPESLKRVQAPLPQRDKGGRKPENTALLSEQPYVPSVVTMTTTSITSTKTISNGRSSDKIANRGVSISTVTSITPSMHTSPVVSSSVSMTTTTTPNSKTLDTFSMTPSVVKLGHPVSIETSAVSKAITPLSIDNPVSRKITPVSIETTSDSKKIVPIATDLIIHDEKLLESLSSLSVSSTRTLTSNVPDVPNIEPCVPITVTTSTDTGILSLESVSNYLPVTRTTFSSKSPSILTTSTTTTMTITTTNKPVKSSPVTSATMTSSTGLRDVDRSVRSNNNNNNNNNPRPTTSSKSTRAKRGGSGAKTTTLAEGSGRRKDSERDDKHHNSSSVNKPAESKNKQREQPVASTDRSIQRSISAQSASSAGSSASSRSKRPHAGIERSLKDLSRHTVMVDRMHTVLNDEVERSSKRIKSVFDEIRQELQRREMMMRDELDAVKKQGNDQFNGRKEKCQDLRMQCERAEVMKESELAELRLDIKHLIADRRIDEDLGRTTRFLYDSDHMINEVRKFGEVAPVSCPYYGRCPSANSSISDSTARDVTTVLNTSMDNSVSSMVKEPKLDSGVVSDSDSATNTAASATDNTNNSNSADLPSAQDMVVIQTRLRNSLRQQGWSINSPPKRFNRPAFANQQQNQMKTRVFENSANLSATDTGAKSKNAGKPNRQRQRQRERPRETNVTNTNRPGNTGKAPASQTYSGLQQTSPNTKISSSEPAQLQSANHDAVPPEQRENNSPLSAPSEVFDNQTVVRDALVETSMNYVAAQHECEDIAEMEGEDIRSEYIPVKNNERLDWAVSVEEEERERELMDGSGDCKAGEESLMWTQDTNSAFDVMDDVPKAQRSRRQQSTRNNNINNNDSNNNPDNIEKYSSKKPSHVKHNNNIKINNEIASNKSSHGEMDKCINLVKTTNEDVINRDLSSRPKKNSATVSVNGTMDNPVKIKRVEVIVNGDCDEGYDATES